MISREEIIHQDNKKRMEAIHLASELNQIAKLKKYHLIIKYCKDIIETYAAINNKTEDDHNLFNIALVHFASYEKVYVRGELSDLKNFLPICDSIVKLFQVHESCFLADANKKNTLAAFMLIICGTHNFISKLEKSHELNDKNIQEELAKISNSIITWSDCFIKIIKKLKDEEKMGDEFITVMSLLFNTCRIHQRMLVLFDMDDANKSQRMQVQLLGFLDNIPIKKIKEKNEKFYKDNRDILFKATFTLKIHEELTKDILKFEESILKAFNIDLAEKIQKFEQYFKLSNQMPVAVAIVPRSNATNHKDLEDAYKILKNRKQMNDKNGIYVVRSQLVKFAKQYFALDQIDELIVAGKLKEAYKIMGETINSLDAIKDGLTAGNSYNYFIRFIVLRLHALFNLDKSIISHDELREFFKQIVQDLSRIQVINMVYEKAYEIIEDAPVTNSLITKANEHLVRSMFQFCYDLVVCLLSQGEIKGASHFYQIAKEVIKLAKLPKDISQYFEELLTELNSKLQEASQIKAHEEVDQSSSIKIPESFSTENSSQSEEDEQERRMRHEESSVVKIATLLKKSGVSSQTGSPLTRNSSANMNDSPQDLPTKFAEIRKGRQQYHSLLPFRLDEIMNNSNENLAENDIEIEFEGGIHSNMPSIFYAENNIYFGIDIQGMYSQLLKAKVQPAEALREIKKFCDVVFSIAAARGHHNRGKPVAANAEHSVSIADVELKEPIINYQISIPNSEWRGGCVELKGKNGELLRYCVLLYLAMHNEKKAELFVTGTKSIAAKLPISLEDFTNQIEHQEGEESITQAESIVEEPIRPATR